MQGEEQQSREDLLKKDQKKEIEDLPRKYDFELVCKSCHRSNRKVPVDPTRGKHCKRHKSDGDPLRLHDTGAEIRPIPERNELQNWTFGLCLNMWKGNKCEKEDQCKYAHNEHELHVWSAEQAILHPRPKTHIPRLQACGQMSRKFCQRGPSCHFAHSEVELNIWKEKYSQDLTTRAPAWQAEVEKEVEKAVEKEGCIKKRLMNIHGECTKISEKHNAYSDEVVKIAVKALIQREVSQRESPTTGSRYPRHRDLLRGEHPFMLSKVDYARRFEDQLSFFLYEVVNKVDLIKKVDEDEYDLRKLLPHLQHNSKKCADRFAMDHDCLYFYCAVLKQIANELAHKAYLTHHYQETGNVEVYMEYGYDLAMQIKRGLKSADQTADLQTRMEELERFCKSFSDFCQCRRTLHVNEKYYRLSERKQEQVAEAVVEQLQEHAKTDERRRAMLGTCIPALAKIDITDILTSLDAGAM